MSFSTAAEFDEAYASVNKAFASGRTKDKKWRKRQLQQAFWMIEDNIDAIIAACKKDLNKHAQETMVSDIGMSRGAMLDALQNFDKWTSDEKPRRWNDPFNWMANATIRKEPKGAVLIMGAWNYPIAMVLEPMAAALTAGCSMILKPSDVTHATQELLKELIPKYLDKDAVRVVTAGAEEMGYILEHKFDHIFYTGSTAVGKIIYQAAAKNVTPVTLELGGQGPAIVTKNADVDLSAKRIAAAKYMNAGQVCVNVNHVFVEPSIRPAFVAALTKHFKIFMGQRDGEKDPPEDFGRIVNTRNFDRLSRLLDATKGTIVFGGHCNRDALYISPTVVVDVQPDDALMTEELFGPILPILDADVDAALAHVRAHEHPLALYPFTLSQPEKERIVNGTRSGGVTVNDALLHVVAKDAPFGGVGGSGIGGYHGPFGMREFSHLRTTVDPPTWLEKALAPRYPPYSLAKANKLPGARSVKNPGFDRQGNPTGLFARLFGGGGGGNGMWFVALFVVAAAAAGVSWWQGLTLLRALSLAKARGVPGSEMLAGVVSRFSKL